jgi:hypothetical protein
VDSIIDQLNRLIEHLTCQTVNCDMPPQVPFALNLKCG